MKTNALKVSLRQNAIYIPEDAISVEQKHISETTSVLLANAVKLGFTFSEDLLHALNQITPADKLRILEVLKEVAGTNKNWAPLVKGWHMPTGEPLTDHIMAFFANIFKAKGTTMPCGHIIPAGTFPLERYNGCPLCGTPFSFGDIEITGQGGKLKVLELWTEQKLQSFYGDLLASKVALDATQADSLKLLLREYPLPDTAIGIKETLMLVIDTLQDQGKAAEAQRLLIGPADILRYLWYKKTGFLQVIEPRTLIKRNAGNHAHIYTPLNKSAQAALAQKQQLKLKYSRKDCLTVATWLNNLDMDVERACESMHPKRGMWVRLIRALRLPEYAQRKGFAYLKDLLDVFYNEAYDVWQGQVNRFRLKYDAAATFALLKQRPGLFARSLFANMLWFGKEETIAAFTEVIDKVPARLVFTLNMYASYYFDAGSGRTVKPLGGYNKYILANPLLRMYGQEQLEGMQDAVADLCIEAMRYRFSLLNTTSKTMFIDPALYKIPVAIGDRSDTVQDMPVALMGTRFPLEGNEVRLFMQWGKNLPAQHLDMDLSCQIAYLDKTDICSYSQLVTTGCKHSGDIRSIPHKAGTAEYINLDINELSEAGAIYVTFSCNAYSHGSITPNLAIGWMDSKYKMSVSERTGVAYDPSCVQHQIRVTQNTAKGMVFGVLDVRQREIIWLEMPFGGQVVQHLDYRAVQTLMTKLSSKLSIGNLLTLKATAQGIALVQEAMADEVYNMEWARNAAAVTQLLID